MVCEPKTYATKGTGIGKSLKRAFMDVIDAEKILCKTGQVYQKGKNVCQKAGLSWK